MKMPFMLVFHQSECISAIKRILFYYFHVYNFEFIYVFVSSLSLRCMLCLYLARCVWEWRRYTQ